MADTRAESDGIDKSIHGKPVSDQAWRYEIMRLVVERVHARPLEIAELLGPEWFGSAEGKHTVNVTMNNMRKQGWLVREKRGTYEVHPNYMRRLSRTLEEQVIDTLASLGGVARARDILEDFDVRPTTDSEYLYGGRANGTTRRIYAELKNSTRVLFNERGGQESRWVLCAEELIKIPLTGAAAAYLMECGFLDAIERRVIPGGQDQHDRVQEDIHEHFSIVGQAFKRVRTLYGVEIEDAARIPEIADVLDSIKQRNLKLVERIHADIRKDAVSRAKEEDRAGDEPYIELLIDQFTEVFLAYILAYFEMGDPETHLCAPSTLYHAVAEHYHIDAASLSRGGVIFMPVRPVEENVEVAADA